MLSLNFSGHCYDVRKVVDLQCIIKHVTTKQLLTRILCHFMIIGEEVIEISLTNSL